MCNLCEKECLEGPLVDVRGRDLRTGGDHVLVPKREGNKMLKKKTTTLSPPGSKAAPKSFYVP